MTLDEALQDVDIAFRQIEFASKLLAYCESEKINAAAFDTDHFVRAAMVTVSLAFGASALALDLAYEVAGVQKDVSSDDNDVRIRTLVFMVRCAYAHGIADPKWEVQGKYRRAISVYLGSEEIDIDLTALDGQSFSFDDLGGHQNCFFY
jgi:hypothetical protein